MNAELAWCRLNSSKSAQVSSLFFIVPNGKKKGWGVVRKGGQKLTVKQSAVFNLIQQDPSISRKTLSEKLGFNESAVQKHLDVLKAKKTIRRSGPLTKEAIGKYTIKARFRRSLGKDAPMVERSNMPPQYLERTFPPKPDVNISGDENQ